VLIKIELKIDKHLNVIHVKVILHNKMLFFKKGIWYKPISNSVKFLKKICIQSCHVKKSQLNTFNNHKFLMFCLNNSLILIKDSKYSSFHCLKGFFSKMKNSLSDALRIVVDGILIIILLISFAF
jgi:hypothetical protein